MNTADQSTVVEFLSSGAAHGATPVERIETHTSLVFLAADRAFKLKRAVRYDYLDYSTLDRRRAMCDAELRLNRRTAPSLYRRVVPVTQQADGSLAIGGTGQPIEWLVEMARFDQACLLDRMAQDGSLSVAAMRPLASAIARFHAQAERRVDHGGWLAMQDVIDGNAAGFRDDAPGVLDASACDSVTERSRILAGRLRTLLDSRRTDRFVRECHGDLHLGNIVMLDGSPTLFDAIEFNDAISCIDVLYDVAFVLMDLWQRGLRDHANALFNGYLAETVDVSGLALMPLFLSCRAAVRAKTPATAAALTTASRARERRTVAEQYLTSAERYLDPPPACLIGIGGLSGSGKSTLARSVAPLVGGAPGAVVLRSDEIRKRLCSAKPFERLGPQGYTPAANRLVYQTLLAQARMILRGGHPVIADAVFARPEDRDALQTLATEAGVPFFGGWLEAAEPVLVSRLEARGPDVSDATPEVVRGQLAADLGPVQWNRIDASRSMPQVIADITRLFPGHLHTRPHDELCPVPLPRTQ